MRSLILFAPFSFLLLIPAWKDNTSVPAPHGPEWVVYTKANSPLRSAHINSLSVDAEGKVWFATDTGAAGLIPSTGGWTVIVDSLKSAANVARVNCVTE